MQKVNGHSTTVLEGQNLPQPVRLPTFTEGDVEDGDKRHVEAHIDLIDKIVCYDFAIFYKFRLAVIRIFSAHVCKPETDISISSCSWEGKELTNNNDFQAI